jgi:hypothetical protein
LDQIRDHAIAMNNAWIAELRLFVTETVADSCQRPPSMKIEECYQQNIGIINGHENLNGIEAFELESLAQFALYLAEKNTELRDLIGQMKECQTPISVEDQLKLAKRAANEKLNENIKELTEKATDYLEGSCQIEPLGQIKALAKTLKASIDDAVSFVDLQNVMDSIPAKVQQIQKEIEESKCTAPAPPLANTNVAYATSIDIDEVGELVYVDASTGLDLLEQFSDFATNHSIYIAEELTKLNLQAHQVASSEALIQEKLYQVKMALEQARIRFEELNNVLQTIVKYSNLDELRGIYQS